jgi:hypothetical protein
VLIEYLVSTDAFLGVGREPRLAITAMGGHAAGNECSKFQLKSLPSKRAGFMRTTLTPAGQCSVNFSANCY